MNLNKLIFSLISILFIFSLFCSFTIGMSWDEPWHHINGALRAEYLKSFGNFKNYDFSDNKFYPGLYDTFSFLFANSLAKIFSEKYYLEIKHLINFAFAIFTLLGLFQISRKLFNKQIAYLATFICFINPFFFGHMSTNPKDIVVCFSLVWFSYYSYIYCKNFEKNRIFPLVLAALFMGFGLGVRVSFFITTIPIIISILIYILNNCKYEKIIIFRKIFFDIAIFTLISVALMMVAWPHVLDNSLTLLIDTIRASINWSGGAMLGLLNGQFYETNNTPRTYLLYFFIFRFPIYILVLLFSLIAILLIDKKFLDSDFLNLKNKIILISSVILFPLLLAVIFKVKLYDGIRLFLFIVPALSLLSAISLYFILNNIKKSAYAKAIGAVISIFFLLFVYRFVYLTPYHYDYSNFLNIKFSNTQNLYEHDYWGISFKELIKLMKKNTDLKEPKIASCGGNIDGINFFLKKYFDKKLTLVPLEKADYIIMINRTSFNINDKSTCYTKHLGKDIISVDRLGVKLSVLRKLKK